MAHLAPIIEKILAAATLAPSAHNTQPWKFTATNRGIEVYVDWDRHLEISDPTHRQLYISIGCAITNAAVAARHFDMEPNSNYFPEGEGKDKPAVHMTLSDSATTQQTTDDLFTVIETRRTNRALYDGKPLTPEQRQQLTQIQQEEITLVENRPAIAAIAKLTERATLATLSRQNFKEELSHWVRNSWTRQPDGMPGYAMGIPAPVSLLAPLMVRLAPIHKQEGPKTRQQVESASAIAVVSTAADTPHDWLKVGQLLELLWLQATAAGLAAAPLAGAIEAGETIRNELKATVHTTHCPQSILRIGHSSETNLKATPRRSVANCLSA